MRSLKKVKKNILAAAMLVILLMSSSLSMAGCAKPPEYSEIEDRFIELVEASMDVNKILENLINNMTLISPDDIPNISLYMDQVTTFMSEHFMNANHTPDDKILTKTMFSCLI